MDHLPKAFQSREVEDDIYAAWEAADVFRPRGDGAPYAIVMPPPNRTGTLHLGHATMIAIQDLLIRFHRMNGDRAWWIPGTDHAAIATQVKVEKELQRRGIKNPRQELGREKFLDEVVAFAQQSRDTIVNQTKKMGASCDWRDERYTLDEERTRAVNEVFKMMFEDGLIERGDRIVNWDPFMHSNVSDDEIEWVEETAPFYTFRYGPFDISTARPETKFGDKYVVMHPDDRRYAKYKHGDTFVCEWINGEITATVIKDEAVDPSFGTGVMTITPWHDATDFEIAERHGLDKEQMIGFDGRLRAVAGEFEGMTIEEARPKIVQKLKEKGLLKGVDEKYIHRVATNYRGGGRIEPQIMRQWFVRVNKPFKLRHATLGTWKKGQKATLKDLMRHAVSGDAGESAKIKIVPERFEKTYFHWIDNLRDWCISRQIWFGHRIPVWYHANVCVPKKGREKDVSQCIETIVSDTEPSCAFCNAKYEQDPDTLDTWFSSGLWTFSALGWPDQNVWATNRAFHPTAILDTGYDILFFWVARMILMSSYVLGEVPFHDVYLHGLVRDEQGRKMSKSLGNVIDPLDVIPKYGTDAVRLSLVLGTAPGQDTRLSEEKIKGFRNFTNKLWNISRYILQNLQHGSENPHSATVADEWILSRLEDVTASVTKKLEAYEFSSAGEELRDFTWGDLADWYLEIAKIEGGKAEILHHILRRIVILWHPFMPFVTEYIWKTAKYGGAVMTTPWPSSTTPFAKDGGRPNGSRWKSGMVLFESLRTVVTAIRRLRADMNVAPKEKLAVAVTHANLEDQKEIIAALVRASSIRYVDEIPKGWVSASAGAGMVAFDPEGAIDVKKEKARLEKELKDAEKYLGGLEKKLGNREFTDKAPEKIVDEMRLKRDEAKATAEALKERLSSM